MVNLFGLHSKGSPSREPSRPDASPALLSLHGVDNATPAMARTDPSTTPPVIPPSHQSSSHFFSLPLWRRRAPPVSNAPARRSFSVLDTDETGTMMRTSNASTLLVDKDLPPTPTSSNEQLPVFPARPSVSPSRPSPEGAKQQPVPVNFPLSTSASRSLSKSSTRSTSSRLASQPTFALAQTALSQATLGLGLPHTVPRPSTSSSTSSIIKVGLADVPESPNRLPPESAVRRVKSFPKLNAYPVQEGAPIVDPRGRRRVRGSSFGSTLSMLDDKGKGKAKVEDPLPDVTPPRKTLGRRTSFWNRKRNESLKQKPPVSVAEQEHSKRPTLPVLPPVSPFYVDTDVSSSSNSLQQNNSVQDPPGLVRRHSERSPPLPSSPSASQTTNDALTPFMIPKSIHRKLGSRPLTADSTLERSRAQSMFIDNSSPQVSQLPPSASQPPIRRSPSPPPVSLSSSRLAPRPRSHTNPPLLHRLSVSFLSFTSSTTPSPVSNNMLGTPNMSSSPSASPRPSLTKPSPVEIPKPNPDKESPEAYLKRLMEGVTKAEVASVLASSGDAFHVAALQLYIDRFEFSRYSIDVALRRLLMDVGLPRETQQIDRVMECFASKYRQCNPDLFVSEDHPYILAFSLIMLHTDAFNKSNKRKMSKADYIKNTRLPGVAPEVLDYFYDNIVFAPFIFVEDPLDPRSSFDAPRLPGLMSAPSLPGNSSTVTLLGKSTKIDPYYLITNDLLDPLRVDVAAYVSFEDPYDFEGTGGPWQEAELRRAFVSSHYIQVDAVESSRRMSTSLFALSVAGFPSPYPNLGAFPDNLLSQTSNGASALRVVKVGLLKRRDITAEGEKRGSKTKWREWSVILTGSQLLLFRDPVWATNLLEQAKRGVAQLLFPPVSLLKPDEILAVKDAVAVYDRSYARYQYAFRFVSGHGHHFLLQATDDPDMNEWISRINYASAFRSAGVNMRPLGLSGKDVELMGVAAAASHLRELQTREENRPSSRVRTWDTRSSEEFVDRLSRSPSSSIGHASRKGRGRTVTGRDDIQLEAPTAPDLDGAQQFKAAFDQVKADLAAGRLAAMDDYVSRPGARPRAYSLESTMRPSFLSDDDDSQRSSSRTQRIQAKIGDLELRIDSTQLELDSHLRLVRNIATLTPFTRATRERLQIAVQRTAKQIKHARLDLARLHCHFHVLQNDLSAEEWDWNRTKTIALKAATKTLYSRRDPSIPRMTLSLHLDEPSRFTSSPRDTSFSSASSHQPESSFRDSFHSALDIPWSSSPVLDGHVYGESPLLDSPLVTPMSEEDRNGSASSFPFLHGNGSFSSQLKSSPSLAARSMTRLSNGTDSPGVRSQHERFVTAPETPEEEAEEWNKTRAAKRVSLVKVPSDLRMGLALGRTGTHSPQPSTRTIRSPLLKPDR